jgi:hypothetical protein
MDGFAVPRRRVSNRPCRALTIDRRPQDAN